MFVVMAVGASDAEVIGVKSRILSEGLTPYEHHGRGATRDRRGRRDREPRNDLIGRFGTLPGRGARDPDQQAVQADEPRVPPRGHGRARPRRGGRRRVADGHGRAPARSRAGTSSMETADAVAAAGATILRGGAFKPRTSPYSFQGLGVEALRYLAEARERTGLPVITEVMEAEPARHRGRVRRHRADRHAQHAELLAAQRVRPDAAAGDAQARLRRHDRGVADGRRVHRQQRQPERDPVRARDPDVRDRDAQHDGRLARCRCCTT